MSYHVGTSHSTEQQPSVSRILMRDLAKCVYHDSNNRTSKTCYFQHTITGALDGERKQKNHWTVSNRVKYDTLVPSQGRRYRPSRGSSTKQVQRILTDSISLSVADMGPIFVSHVIKPSSVDSLRRCGKGVRAHMYPRRHL